MPLTASCEAMAKKTGTNGEAFSVFRKMNSVPAVAVHGQVFTKRHIVEFILDLAGYTGDKPLHKMTLLEPGCGNGAFLITAAKRLLATRPPDVPLPSLSTCLLGFEKDAELVEQTRRALLEVLLAHGVNQATATRLAATWVVCDDFLAMRTETRFDFVTGNPPYVRQEAIPKELVNDYRERFSCFYDRADLYVAFFERSLEMLSEQGTLAFICPNRFTKNNYGRKLRKRITEDFKLTHVVDLPEASPFEPEVLSYPGIYVVQRGTTESVHHVLMREASPEECKGRWRRKRPACKATSRIIATRHGFRGRRNGPPTPRNIFPCCVGLRAQGFRWATRGPAAGWALEWPPAPTTFTSWLKIRSTLSRNCCCPW